MAGETVTVLMSGDNARDDRQLLIAVLSHTPLVVDIAVNFSTIVYSGLDRGIQSASELLPSLEKGARVLHKVITAHPLCGRQVLCFADALVVLFLAATLVFEVALFDARVLSVLALLFADAVLFAVSVLTGGAVCGPPAARLSRDVAERDVTSRDVAERLTATARLPAALSSCSRDIHNKGKTGKAIRLKGVRVMRPPCYQINLHPRMTLTFDLLNPKVDRHVLAPWTTCINLHPNRFIRFQYIVFTSLVTDRRTDGRTT